MRTVSKAVEAIRHAASTLLDQHKYSNGHISVGESEIDETNIVIHVGSSFIRSGGTVWAESPFKTHENNYCKHIDLAVDLYADPEYSRLLVIEAKRVAFSERDSKIQEILDDYVRIESWRTLDESHFPLFFAIFQPVEWLYGAIVVITSERCNNYGTIPKDSISEWWQSLDGNPTGFTADLIAKLKKILESAAERGILVAERWNGFAEAGEVSTRMAVMFAIFDFGPTKTESNVLTARHEAAHAVVARRLGVPVRKLALTDDEDLVGGAICDWESLSGSVDGRTICTYAFAIAYAGALHDVRATGKDFDEIFNALPTDHDAVVYARNKLKEWENLASTNETMKESSEGCKLAEQIIAEEYDRIERLGAFLLERHELEEDSISAWFVLDGADSPDTRFQDVPD